VTARRDTRLVIAERLTRRDHLHGAWWPYTTNIERELAAMLKLAITRSRAVLGVTLNRDEWPGAPLLLQPLATSSPKISWYGLTEPHLAMLHCGGHNRIALLVLPPDAPEEIALTAMLMASTPGTVSPPRTRWPRPASRCNRPARPSSPEPARLRSLTRAMLGSRTYAPDHRPERRQRRRTGCKGNVVLSWSYPAGWLTPLTSPSRTRHGHHSSRQRSQVRCVLWGARTVDRSDPVSGEARPASPARCILINDRAI
jgi:Family of unknown function (DUF5994)